MPGAYSSKRHLLFDFDGTLVDSSAAHAHAYLDTLKKNHPQLAKNFDYTRIAGQPTRQSFAALGVQDEAGLSELTQRKQQFYRDAIERGEVVVFPGVPELLARLAETDRSLFIVTGASRISAERILERTHLRRYFSGLITAEDSPSGKPAPDPYLRALAAYHLAPVDCLAIEDGVSGVQSAQAAGLDVVLIHSELGLPGVPNVRNSEGLATLLLT
jgi:HAD superfamily hydrolase (TIGR01509 family)